MILICVLVWYDNALCRQVYDADIKPERPVFDVPDVSLDTFFHLPKLFGLATVACHLGPSRYAWLGEMSYHVFVNDVAINLSMVQHVRAWTYDAHVTFQHIVELWKFINVGFSHEIAKGKLARVVSRRLGSIGILVHMHGPKFVA